MATSNDVSSQMASALDRHGEIWPPSPTRLVHERLGTPIQALEVWVVPGAGRAGLRGIWPCSEGRVGCETSTMEGTDYLIAIRLESEDFSQAARRDLTAAVPSCPGWTVADLVGHLGGVQSWVAG